MVDVVVEQEGRLKENGVKRHDVGELGNDELDEVLKPVDELGNLCQIVSLGKIVSELYIHPSIQLGGVDGFHGGKDCPIAIRLTIGGVVETLAGGTSRCWA